MPIWGEEKAICLLFSVALTGAALGAELPGPSAASPDTPGRAMSAPSDAGCSHSSADGPTKSTRRAWTKLMKARARDLAELDRQQNDLGRHVDMLVQAATGTPPDDSGAQKVFSSLWTVDPIYDLRNAALLLAALLSRAGHLQDQLAADRERLACLWRGAPPAPPWGETAARQLADWEREVAVTRIMLSTKQDRLAPVLAAWAEQGGVSRQPPASDVPAVKRPDDPKGAPAPPPGQAGRKRERPPISSAALGPDAVGHPDRLPPRQSESTLVSVIRFDAPGVDLRPELRTAVSAARRSGEDVVLVAVSPLRRDDQTFMLERAAAQQYARAVGRALAGLGVEPDHIYMAAASRGDVNASEVHIYVRPSAPKTAPR